MRQAKTDIRRPRRTVIRDYPYAPGGRLAWIGDRRRVQSERNARNRKEGWHGQHH